MDVDLPKPGAYVVAVSGGVDSVALLDLLHKALGVKLTVAHYDHGIRDNSAEDRRFVGDLAKAYGLPFVYDEGRLGAGASEATARSARYGFLVQVQRASAASAVITAHHQDDLLETAIINLLRGSGRKGLTSLSSRPGLLRPLLKVPKRDLISYAQSQGLKWHEDSTNQDQAYLRNYVRHKLLTQFTDHDRRALRQLINNQASTNQELDDLLAKQLKLQPVVATIDRQWFNQLPHDVAKEMMASWLRANDLRDFDAGTLERLVRAAKTAATGKVFPVHGERQMIVKGDHLALAPIER